MNTTNDSKTTTVALLPETCVRGVKHIRAEAYSRRKRIGWIECQAHRQSKEKNELEIGCLQVNEPWRGQGTGAQLIDLIVRTYGEIYNMKLCARPLCAAQTMNIVNLVAFYERRGFVVDDYGNNWAVMCRSLSGE